jgi:hypothetical protein
MPFRPDASAVADITPVDRMESAKPLLFHIETERSVSAWRSGPSAGSPQVKETTVKMRVIAPVAAAAIAAAVGFAPIAAATTTTTNTGGATVVESPGNAQVTAQPGVAALQAGELQYPFWGFTPLELHHQIEHHHH